MNAIPSAIYALTVLTRQHGDVMSTLKLMAPNARTWTDGATSYEIAFDENDTVTDIHKREGYYVSR